jgi:hypothetical protein
VQFLNRLPSLFQCCDFALQVRADAFQSIILSQRAWEKFSIWGCGRDGKRFFNLLTRENKQKVRSLSMAQPF